MAYILGASNHVNGSSGDLGSGGTATLSVGTVLPGSVLVSALSSSGNETITGMTGGGTWAGFHQPDVPDNQNADFFYCLSAAGGATTITVHFTGGSGGLSAAAWTVAEIQVPSAMLFDAADSSKAFATSTLTANGNVSNPLAVAAAGELIVVTYAGMLGAAPTLTPGTGFTTAVLEPGTAGVTGTSALEFQSGGAGPITGTWTSNKATDTYTAQILALAPSAPPAAGSFVTHLGGRGAGW